MCAARPSVTEEEMEKGFWETEGRESPQVTSLGYQGRAIWAWTVLYSEAALGSGG